MITHNRLIEVLRYNSKTGEFFWIKEQAGGRGRRKVVKAGDLAGSVHKHNGYVVIYIDTKAYFAHRLAWFYVHKAWPKHYIDHLNHNRSDNRIANLRDVRSGPNLHNRAKEPEGVFKSKDRNGWSAHIGVKGKNHFLGRYETEVEARAARIGAEKIVKEYYT